MSIPLAVALALAAGPPETATTPPDPADFAEKAVTRIAFGSCANHEAPQPIWDHVARWTPDVFIMLGDNIYGDTEDMAVLAAKYDQLGSKPEFQRVAAEVPFLATWDDHDYGVNDGGIEYPMKAESKEVMLTFFGEPEDSPRWDHEGIYHSTILGPPGQRVQFILLDLRTFRTPLSTRTRTAREQSRAVGPYVPVEEASMLGAEQWAWLLDQLRTPAELRIICMSTQFLVEYNGWEAWANLPRERAKLIDMIRRTRAEGVLFISGDTHWAELSMVEAEGLYPLYDLTSSGLTNVWSAVAPNRNRVVGSHLGANFGHLEIDWNEKNPLITMRIVGDSGAVHLAHEVRLGDLDFRMPRIMPPRSFAGEWESDFGVMSLTVTDGALAGRYGDDHRIEGTVEDGVARGTWRHRDSAAEGPFEFRLSRDGQFLLGSWAYVDDSPAADGGLPFSWRGTRRQWK